MSSRERDEPDRSRLARRAEDVVLLLELDRSGSGQGLGSRCSAGFCGAVGVRLFGGRRGIEVTTSGSDRVFSVRSMAATIDFGARATIGAEKTRTATSSQ